MEIRIGIINSPRELNFESSQPASEVQKAITTALDSAAPLLVLNDDKDKTYLVPTATIAFVEIGGDESRRVGFVM